MILRNVILSVSLIALGGSAHAADEAASVNPEGEVVTVDLKTGQKPVDPAILALLKQFSEQGEKDLAKTKQERAELKAQLAKAQQEVEELKAKIAQVEQDTADAVKAGEVYDELNKKLIKDLGLNKTDEN